MWVLARVGPMWAPKWLGKAKTKIFLRFLKVLGRKHGFSLLGWQPNKGFVEKTFMRLPNPLISTSKARFWELFTGSAWSSRSTGKGCQKRQLGPPFHTPILTVVVGAVFSSSHFSLVPLCSFCCLSINFVYPHTGDPQRHPQGWSISVKFVIFWHFWITRITVDLFSSICLNFC